MSTHVPIALSHQMENASPALKVANNVLMPTLVRLVSMANYSRIPSAKTDATQDTTRTMEPALNALLDAVDATIRTLAQAASMDSYSRALNATQDASVVNT